MSPDTILQNRYRIVRQLGQGGMGTVYEAIDERLDTAVALKETKFTDERLCKQFEREARLLARLHHPALPRVTDHFTENVGQFLVMQFIAGEDLSEMLNKRGKPFPVNEVVGWADQLLDALEYLHAQEPPVIHRDIKPQNLKLTSRGQIILLDFGLAKGFAGQVSRITASGSIFGYTPNYAPLEQIQGTGTDPRSDLYALAATLYHLLTGVAPPDVLTRLAATSNSQPDPLRPAHELNAEVPVGLSNVLQKGLAIGSSQRFARASAMRKALESVSQPTTAKETKTTTSQPTMLDLPATQVAKEKVAPETSPTPSSPDSASRLIDQSVLITQAPSIKPGPQQEVWKPQPSPIQPALKSKQPASPERKMLLIFGGIALLLIVVYIIIQAGRTSSGNQSGSGLDNTTTNTNNTTTNTTTTTYTPSMTSSNMNTGSSSNTNSSPSVSFYPYTGRLTALLPKTVGAFTLDSTDTSPDEEFRKTLGASEMTDSVYATSSGRAVHLALANFSTPQKAGSAFSALKELFSQGGFRVVDEAVSGKVVMEGKAPGKSGKTRFIQWTKGTVLFTIKNNDTGDTDSISEFEKSYPYSF